MTTPPMNAPIAMEKPRRYPKPAKRKQNETAVMNNNSGFFALDLRMYCRTVFPKR